MAEPGADGGFDGVTSNIENGDKFGPSSVAMPRSGGRSTVPPMAQSIYPPFFLVKRFYKFDLRIPVV